MRIHLVSYATPRFYLRQSILGLSARMNRVADTVTLWNPKILLQSGFEESVPDIQLTERGSGFWAWKPFIIKHKLDEVPDGDIVFYCDVGRLYPFKLIEQPLLPYLLWMDELQQDVMPGILIPWDGTTATWTRRSVLQALGMDRPDVHAAMPVQASFSIWRASQESRKFVDHWFSLCKQRPLISDDPGPPEIKPLPEFRAHRHDQAILTLCCIEHSIHALAVGDTKPVYDSKDPSMVAKSVFGVRTGFPRFPGIILKFTAHGISLFEKQFRKFVKFGKPIQE